MRGNCTEVEAIMYKIQTWVHHTRMRRMKFEFGISKVSGNRPFATMGWSRGILTPKTMCNQNLIYRNEKNRSKLVVLQSFSIVCYIFGKLEHFQIPNFNRVCGWMATLAVQQLFPIQILLIFLRFELPPKFIFQCYRPQTWQLYLFFTALSISSIHKVPSIKLKGW